MKHTRQETSAVVTITKSAGRPEGRKTAKKPRAADREANSIFRIITRIHNGTGVPALTSDSSFRLGGRIVPTSLNRHARFNNRHRRQASSGIPRTDISTRTDD
ncbi:MAG: hypothetical protein PUA47_02060 [Bacteroidales bacterium]|nr:hypothetical protein [Bacteroidales bacterium]